MSDTTIAHIAAQDVTIGGRRLRQRCAWCGATIVDVDLTNTAVQVEPGEAAPRPATWEPGALVRIEGTNPRMFSLVEPELLGEEPQLPDDACANISDEVTA